MNIKLRDFIKIIVLIGQVFFIHFLCFINTDTDIRVVGLIISGLTIAIIGYLFWVESKSYEIIKEQSNIRKLYL